MLEETESIKSPQDLGNFLTRQAKKTQEIFANLPGFESFWRELVHYGDEFPVGLGFAARAAGGTPENFDHLSLWYRLQTVTYNTKPLCLESLFADSVNLGETLFWFFLNLKRVTNGVFDDFSRNAFVCESAFRWTAVDKCPKKGAWSFKEDENGSLAPEIILLADGVDPQNISALQENTLDYIRKYGTWAETFPAKGHIPLVTDEETFGDTNILGEYKFQRDEMPLRYNFSDEGFEHLKRVLPDDPTYPQADFQLSMPLSAYPVFELQYSAPSQEKRIKENWLEHAWKWVCDVNEITPCNVDRNRGFFRMLLNQAAKPKLGGFRGHVILHRRFHKFPPVFRVQQWPSKPASSPQ
jgi:hypothetical protein